MPPRQEAQNKATSAARRAETDPLRRRVRGGGRRRSSPTSRLRPCSSKPRRDADADRGDHAEPVRARSPAPRKQASSNMQSVATATEELSASVDEIGRRVRESSQIADAAVRQAEQTDGRIGKLSRAAQRDRRRGQADHGDRRADQPAGAERHHRGGARRRCRPRLRGGRLRGQIARQPDREGDRRDLNSHLGHAGRDAGIGRRDQGDRRHHRHRSPEIAVDHRQRRRAAKLGDAGNRPQRAECRPGHRRRPPPASCRSTAAPPKPVRRRKRC